jgi:hypothetical protein
MVLNMSRPSKLNDATKARLIQAIEGGMNYEDACRLAKITYKTFSNWMKKGKAAKSGAFFQFFQDIEYAKAKGLAFHLGVINNAARNGDWHASRYICQARHGMVIKRDEQPHTQMNIQVNAEQLNVQGLIEQIKINSKLIEQFETPKIDLDEE